MGYKRKKISSKKMDFSQALQKNLKNNENNKVIPLSKNKNEPSASEKITKIKPSAVAVEEVEEKSQEAQVQSQIDEWNDVIDPREAKEAKRQEKIQEKKKIKQKLKKERRSNNKDKSTGKKSIRK